MKLDPTVMRTMVPEDFRVMEAVERGMQKHALVPAPLIASLANLRHGGTGKIVSSLLRDKLLSHDKSCGYDGYRLTNAGYDILALHNLKSKKLIAALGDRIGTGKESDIYLAVHPNGQQVVLKFHRLGRTSFRNVKKTRDYFVYHQQQGHRKGGGLTSPANQANSWLFLSRKSALKEYAFMKALYNVGYPTPTPLGQNRHIVVMSLIRGVPLYQIRPQNLSSEQAASIFHQAADLAVRLAQHGLVHCDLNEFNLLVDMSGIQHKAMSQEHDPYVRHSGMSIAAESTPGMLSARGPWEPEYLQQQYQQLPEEDAGSHVEEPPKPVEYLDNGEPKPIVTLIDFPQMVSTHHPNAKELYERDTACLYKFFSHKLQFQIPESEREKLYLTWESIQEILQQPKQEDTSGETAAGETAAGTSVDDTQSVSLAIKAQLRLDQELQASGYSEDDRARGDMDLYYYYNGQDRSSMENGMDEEAAATTKVDEDDEENNEHDDNEEEEGNDEEEGKGEDAANDDFDNDLDLDGTSVATGRSNLPSPSVIGGGELLNEMNRQQLQEIARLRVQQQLEVQKKKNQQRGAFRKRNSNKSYVKGKRVFQDVGIP